MAVRMRQVREVWHSGLFWQAALALYVLFVYGHSLVPAELSSRESGAVLQMIAKIWDGLRLPGQMPTEHMVRKTAHFLEYMGMGVLLCRNVQVMARQRRILLRSVIAAAIWLPFVDETIQLFSPGRASRVADVWIDFAGLLTGLLLFHWFRRQKKNETERSRRSDV